MTENYLYMRADELDREITRLTKKTSAATFAARRCGLTAEEARQQIRDVAAWEAAQIAAIARMETAGWLRLFRLGEWSRTAWGM